MKNLLLKVLLFIIINIILIVITMFLFRSVFPYLWFVFLVVHIITLIAFPYVKFFKLNQKNEKF